MLQLAVLLVTALAIVSLGEALVSLRAGLRFRLAFRGIAHAPLGEFAPPTSLIVPCRGVDPGLEDNLRGFFALQYPQLQLLFVTDSRTDPCVPVIQRLLEVHPHVAASLVYAGPAHSRGQKVHNLLHALSFVRNHDEVLAFGDSDIRPDPHWLHHLVEPLQGARVGVSTGFRWYVPQRTALASVLRSVWNAGIVGLMEGAEAPFAWGGAMAMRRRTFDDAAVRVSWQGALSDDYAVSRAIRDAGLAIHFQPRCLSFTHEDCTLREFLAWSLRQLAITRVYHRRLWMLGLASELLNNLAFWGGIVVVAVAAALGRITPAVVILTSLVGATYVVRAVKAWWRWRAVADGFPRHATGVRRYRWAYALLGPVSSLVTLSGLVRSMFSREIEWRGIRYRMVSSTTTDVL